MTKIKNLPYTFIKGEDDSQTLVFIHGSGCNKKFLKPIANKVKKYDSYLIDLPGHGESTDKTYDFDHYVDSIVEFVKDLNNVTIIGHSLGGTLVLAVGAKQLESVKNVVVLDGAAKYDIDKGFMDKIKQGVVDIEAVMALSGSLDNPTVVEALSTIDPPEVMCHDFIIDEALDINDQLQYINVPTLVMIGEDEVLVPVETARHLERNVKDTKVIVVPNTMHMMPVAEVDLVVKSVLDFIK